MMNVLNSVWLRTFVVLCDVGHYTRAAAELNMTQPGVSQHIKKLEQQVGQPLLSKDGKSFTLTPAGVAVLAVGQRRQAEDKALRIALQYDDPDIGQVSVACSGSLAMLLYPPLMDLMTAALGLSIRLEAAPQMRILEGVTENLFDLGIAEHAPTHPRLEAELIGHDELCLVLPKGARDPDALSEIEHLGFIAHPDGFGQADELLSANFPSEYRGVDQLTQRSFVNQIGQIPEPVVRGLGYTVLPKSGVDAFAGREGLHVAALPHPIRHELWLIHRKGRVLPARARKARAVIQQTLAAP